MKFLKISVKNHQIMHGFDKDNNEIIQDVKVEKATVKLIAIDRILSISEKYILTTYSDRLIYWEYQEAFTEIMEQFTTANLLID